MCVHCDFNVVLSIVLILGEGAKGKARAPQYFFYLRIVQF
jgi:hypothetical protein